jgi:hypothetical protein
MPPPPSPPKVLRQRSSSFIGPTYESNRGIQKKDPKLSSQVTQLMAAQIRARSVGPIQTQIRRATWFFLFFHCNLLRSLLAFITHCLLLFIGPVLSFSSSCVSYQRESSSCAKNRHSKLLWRAECELGNREFSYFHCVGFADRQQAQHGVDPDIMGMYVLQA